MSSREKKVKRIVISASNIKKSNNDDLKNNCNNKQIARESGNTNTQSHFTVQQMQTSRYRLSRVRNNLSNNRAIESEFKETFCSKYFKNNPDMLDTRPPSIKLIEYYEKLGINDDKRISQDRTVISENIKFKINNDEICKFDIREKHNNQDNISFSCTSLSSDFSSSFTRKEKIQLLSQMLPLETMVHGINSFENLRAHVLLAHFYNRTNKPQPAIRHLNEAQKIQLKIFKVSKQDDLTVLSPTAPSRSSKTSRKTSPSSIRSRKRSPNKQQECDSQFSNQIGFFNLTEEQENDVDDEISIEYANAHLMIAMDHSTPASSRSKHIQDATINLSRFNDQLINNQDNVSQKNDHLIYQKNLAKARLLFLQKKFDDSAKYFDSVLTNIDNLSNSNNPENESKSSKSYQKEKKIILNEAVKLDELEESAGIKIEAAENIKMIIRSQMNIIKATGRTIKTSTDENDRYENLLDDIDYALDLYCEARDAYYDIGLDDEEEDCIEQIRQLEKDKNEVYRILDQEQEERQKKLRQEEEEEDKLDNEKINKSNKNDQSVENTIEVNFGSSDSLEEKENQIAKNLIENNKPTIDNNPDEATKENNDEIKNEKNLNENSKDDNELNYGENLNETGELNKLDVGALTPLIESNKKESELPSSSQLIQNENEYGSDENEDQTKTTQKEIENDADSDIKEPEKSDKNDEEKTDKEDLEISAKNIIKTLDLITNSLMNEDKQESNQKIQNKVSSEDQFFNNSSDNYN